MIIDMIEVLLFLCIIIVPIAGPRKRKSKIIRVHPSAKIYSDYRVNETGSLEFEESNRY